MRKGSFRKAQKTHDESKPGAYAVSRKFRRQSRLTLISSETLTEHNISSAEAGEIGSGNELDASNLSSQPVNEEEQPTVAWQIHELREELERTRNIIANQELSSNRPQPGAYQVGLSWRDHFQANGRSHDETSHYQDEEATPRVSAQLVDESADAYRLEKEIQRVRELERRLEQMQALQGTNTQPPPPLVEGTPIPAIRTPSLLPTIGLVANKKQWRILLGLFLVVAAAVVGIVIYLINSNPTPPPELVRGDSRMIAYFQGQELCPTLTQLEQYTHVMFAFDTSYIDAGTPIGCSPTCEIATPTICNGGVNASFISNLHAAGKKAILSFGGTKMGSRSQEDSPKCWENCYGRTTKVVKRLTAVVKELDLDGVNIDYEYFYNNDPSHGFTKGAEAQTFLRDITVGLRSSLPPGSIVTHSPTDRDMVQGSTYYDLLKNLRDSLDFLMPKYYNGITRPTRGVFTKGAGSISALLHYTTLVNDMFNRDATKVVFGFCVGRDQCQAGYESDSKTAAAIMKDVARNYKCNGGAFFWLADTNYNASIVQQEVLSNQGCSALGPCGEGNINNGICSDGTCCSKFGYCGTTIGHCFDPSQYCGNYNIGNGTCADASICCNENGFCHPKQDRCLPNWWS